MTPELLNAATKCGPMTAAKWAAPINAAMQKSDIGTPARIAAFVAQIAYESSTFHCLAEMWDPANCPWQAKYENNPGLGNTQPGDGKLFRGRGLIMITGRYNYGACGRALGINLIANPELLEQPENAADSSGWFWQSHRLNDFADSGDFEEITRRINGGANGEPGRLALWASAKAAICS